MPHSYGNSHAKMGSQCYTCGNLTPGRGLVLDLATLEGCKAEWTQLAGLHTEVVGVRLPEDGHPSQY